MSPTRREFLQQPGFASLGDVCAVHLPTGLVVLTESPGPSIIDPNSSNYIAKQDYDKFLELWETCYAPMRDPSVQNFATIGADASLTSMLEVHPLYLCAGCDRFCYPPNIARDKQSSEVYKSHVFPKGECFGGPLNRRCGFHLLSDPPKYIILKDSRFTQRWLEEHPQDADIDIADEPDKKPAVTSFETSNSPSNPNGNTHFPDVIEISDDESDSDSSIIGEPLTIHSRISQTQSNSPSKSKTESISQTQPPSASKKNTLRNNNSNNNYSKDFIAARKASQMKSTQFFDAMEQQPKRPNTPPKTTATESASPSPKPIGQRAKKHKRTQDNATNGVSPKKRKVQDPPKAKQHSKQQVNEEPEDEDQDEVEAKINIWSERLIDDINKQVKNISNNATYDSVSERFNVIWREYLDSGVPSLVGQMLLGTVKNSIEKSCLTVNNYSILIGPGRIEVSEAHSNLTITVFVTNTSHDCRLHWNIRVVVADDGSDSDDEAPSKYQYLEQYEANDLTISELCQFVIVQRTFLSNFITSLSNKGLSPSENTVCQASWAAIDKAKLADHVALEVVKHDASKQWSHAT